MRHWVPLLIATCALAQDYRGRVQGVVTDPTNSVIAGATITLTNSQTRVSTARTTDVHGHYLFDFVEPGIYSVAAASAGFGNYQRENLQVLVRSDLTVNMTLKLGDVSQSVTVADSAVEIQFNTTTLSQTVDGTGPQSVHACPAGPGRGEPILRRVEAQSVLPALDHRRRCRRADQRTQ
jgi:hypothetical protein